MRTIPNLGIENTAIQLGDPTAAPQRTAGRSTPRLEYDFYTFEQGSVDVPEAFTEIMKSLHQARYVILLRKYLRQL